MGGALLSLAGRDLGDGIEDVLSIRVGTVDCTAIGLENNGTLLSATCEPSEPQWVRGYVHVETALGGGAELRRGRRVGWHRIDGGAADAVLSGGNGSALSFDGCGWFAMPTGTTYDTGTSLHTSGENEAFYGETCEPNSANCGWFVLPEGTTYDTGRLIGKAYGTTTVFHLTLCAPGSEGCGYFHLPEGTFFDDGSYQTAGAATAFYALTCFPQEGGGRRRLRTNSGSRRWEAEAQPDDARRRLSEESPLLALIDDTFEDVDETPDDVYYEGDVYTEASALTAALADAEIADAAEIVISFLGTPRQSRDGRAVRAVPRRLARALRRREPGDELGRSAKNMPRRSPPRSSRRWRARRRTRRRRRAARPLHQCVQADERPRQGRDEAGEAAPR